MAAAAAKAAGNGKRAAKY
jgi:hypothetical protein